MGPLIESFLLVSVGEMGDKTQLLALMLTARYRAPRMILAGIFAATILNHALATAVGTWVAARVPPESLRVALALLFFAFALWALKPDHADEPTASRRSVFWATFLAFFVAEMGDKTQLVTVALGARHQNAWLVTLGTTLGMMGANALAVVFGNRLMRVVPWAWIRRCAALLFLAFGIAVLAA